MIGRIKGNLINIDGNRLLVDVHGIGYELEVTAATLTNVVVGDELELYTHFSVREDAQILYGFANQAERDLFRVLIKVNGVGPKMAIGLLSGMGTNEFAHSIMAQNVAALVKLPGVGKKTAERLVVEMKDKVAQWIDTESLRSDRTEEKTGFQNEAEKALVVLGYKPLEASRLVSSVFKASMTIEEIVKAALRSGLKQLL
jgi:Holliday junction DNA helicase RuvA